MYEQPFNPYAANLDVVKGYFKQTKVMILGILYILSAVLGAVVSAVAANSVSGMAEDVIKLIESLAEKTGINISSLDLNALREQISSSSVTSSIPSMVISCGITVLIAAAFFIIYSKSRSSSAESSPVSGVSILYVLAIISLVFTIIAVVGVVLLVILFMYLAGSITSSTAPEYYDLGNGYQISFDRSALSIVIIVIAVILLLVIVYALISAISKKRYYGSVKESLTTVELQNKGAKAYGVICVINAVFTGMSVLSTLSSLIALGSLGLSSTSTVVLLSGLNTILSFAILVFEAKVALGYKKYIDEMKYGYNGSAPYGGRHAGGYNPDGNLTNPYSNVPRQDYNDGFSPDRFTPPEMPDRRNTDISGAGPAGSFAPAPEPEDKPQYDSANVCPYCGAPIGSTPFCGNCGAKL